MKGRRVIVASVLGALVVAGCGSSGGTNASGGGGTKACTATIGFEGPITGPVAVLGKEQLNFAQLALSMDNTGEQDQDALSRVTPSSTRPRRFTVTQQFTSDSSTWLSSSGRKPGSRGDRSAMARAETRSCPAPRPPWR
jgi:hypothetical protein